MEDSASALQKAVEDLRRATEEREKLMRYRDEQIRRALADGVTWVRVQDITGLGPHGVAMAVKRLPRK
jgi:hypothetical protein